MSRKKNEKLNSEFFFYIFSKIINQKILKHRKSDLLVPFTSFLLDIIAIEAAFFFSYWLRFYTDFLSFFHIGEEIPSLAFYTISSIIVLVIWLLILNFNKMYSPRRIYTLSDEFIQIGKSVTLGVLLIIGIAFFYREFSYSRYFIFVLWFSGIIFIFIERVFILLLKKRLYKKSKELRQAVIIGNNDTANTIYTKISSGTTHGIKIIGYFSDSPVLVNTPLFQSKYLGTIEQLPEMIEKKQIELALISIDEGGHSKLFTLLKHVEGINIELIFVPDMIEIMSGRMNVSEIEGIPFIKIKGIPITTWGKIIKRIFDIVFAATVIIVSLPVTILIGVLIKLNSKGPIFYKQARIGLNGEIFNVYKFRTMKTDAEKNTGPVWAVKNDPRTTAIGKFLRRTSLDELPQFLNVIAGSMSIVGPRPERPHFVNQFKEKVPKYLDRHLLRTGITGWAQVNGLRGQSSIEDRTKFDLYYIENWSLTFDIKIIFKTIKAVIFGKDAY